MNYDPLADLIQVAEDAAPITANSARRLRCKICKQCCEQIPN